MRTFTARYTQEDDGGYSVQLVEEPGVISQGDSREEARRYIRDAAALWYEIDEADIEIVDAPD